MRFGAFDIRIRMMRFHHRLDLLDPLLRYIDEKQDLALFQIVLELRDLGIGDIDTDDIDAAISMSSTEPDAG